MNRLPITAAVSQVLALLELSLPKSTANTGVAGSINPEAEPRASNADLTPRIASGSQCSDQRPTVIGETVGWRLQEPSEDTITQGTDLLLQL